jgi:hypothetical protein
VRSIQQTATQCAYENSALKPLVFISPFGSWLRDRTFSVRPGHGAILAGYQSLQNIFCLKMY